MRRPPSTFMLLTSTALALAAAGIVLVGNRTGNPLPTPLPQLVIGLAAVLVLVVLMIVPAVPVNLASRIEIALPPEHVYDRLADVIWWAARNRSLRRIEVFYTRSGEELVPAGARSFIGRRIVLLGHRLEATRPNLLVSRIEGSGTRTLYRRVLTRTPTGTLLESSSDMRVSVYIGAAFALRRRKNREGYAAELARLKADLESTG
jgi:hypothetical protein